MSDMARYMDSKYARASSHYSGWDGRARFYLGGHGYFAVGEKVSVYAAYDGVTTGTVEHAHEDEMGRVVYTVKLRLPKGHDGAYDENGRPQYTKRVLVNDVEMTRYNPEK